MSNKSIGGCGKCGARWTGMNLCHCATCHLTFTSLTGFDDHRVGSHFKGTRGCMDIDQLRSNGYELNHRGHWRRPSARNFWKPVSVPARSTDPLENVAAELREIEDDQ